MPISELVSRAEVTSKKLVDLVEQWLGKGFSTFWELFQFLGPWQF